MADHEMSIEVSAPAQQLFEYLADVRHLSDYFASMTSAEPAEGDAVHVVADVNGNRVEGEAWFRVERGQQHLEWGSEGENGYRGALDVTGESDASQVTVTLHTEHGEPAQIESGIRSTLDEVKRLVESGPAPSTS